MFWYLVSYIYAERLLYCILKFGLSLKRITLTLYKLYPIADLWYDKNMICKYIF
jgi:hypothetical protein